MAVYQYARTVLLAGLLGATGSMAQAETQYYEGTFTCKGIERHNFWAVDLDEKTAQVGIRRADRTNNPTINPATLEIDGDDIKLAGTRNARFFAKGTLSDGNNALSLIWTNKQGKVTATCDPFTLTRTDDTPEARWDAYIALVETPEPTTDDMERSIALTRQLPHADLLPALDQQAYRQKRQAANKAFRQRYQTRIPAIIAASAVATPEDRETLRAELTRMQNFKFRVDLPGLYAQHLYRNDVAPEPAFFSNGEDCAQFSTKPQFYSVDHIENFVGLPRYWWTREQANGVIQQAESCAEQDPAMAGAVNQMTKAISSRFPELEAAVEAKQFLEDEATRHAALEPGLAAIKDSASFSIDRNKRNQLRVSEAYYGLFYRDAVTDIRTASVTAAKDTVPAIFADDTPIMPSTGFGSNSIQNCDDAFGARHYDAASPMAQVHKHCLAVAASALEDRINTKLAALESDDVAIDDLGPNGELSLDRNTQNAAARLGLGEILGQHSAAFSAAQANVLKVRVAKIEAAVARVTEGDSAEFDALCKDVQPNRAMAQACGRGHEAIKALRLQAQCDAKLAGSSLAEEYLDDVIAYTSPLDGRKAEIPVRELVCLMTRGDQFSFQTSGFSVWTTTQFTLGPKGAPDALVGDLALISEDGTRAVWEVEAIDSAPKGFEEIEPTVIIGCIAEKVRC